MHICLLSFLFGGINVVEYFSCLFDFIISFCSLVIAEM